MSKASTLVLTALGLFMVALDTLIVATALPVLRADLGASLADLEWTVNAYNLAFACLLPTGATLGDRFGRRRMFVTGLAVFTLASAAAAIAPGVPALIAARALQGAGAALVTPLSLTLITEAFPAGRRGAAIGMWGGISGLAVALGPVVGGAVVSGVDWRWIFWINVPIGAVLAPLCALLLRESRGPRPRLDLPGLALAALGLLALAWGAIRAQVSGWGGAETLGSLIAGAALIAAFVAWERRAAHPMLPLRLFADRGFAAANAAGFFTYASLLGALFVVAQFFQVVLRQDPLGAGLRILPWTAAPMVVAPLAGALADRFGTRPLMTLGLALQAAGLGAVALTAEPAMGYAGLAAALAVAGIGVSLAFPTVANAIMSAASPGEAGVASGVSGVTRNIGGVFGVSLVAAVLSRPGLYGSPEAFTAGFVPALTAGAALSAAGAVAALLTAGRSSRTAAALDVRPVDRVSN